MDWMTLPLPGDGRAVPGAPLRDHRGGAVRRVDHLALVTAMLGAARGSAIDRWSPPPPALAELAAAGNLLTADELPSRRPRLKMTMMTTWILGGMDMPLTLTMPRMPVAMRMRSIKNAWRRILRRMARLQRKRRMARWKTRTMTIRRTVHQQKHLPSKSRLVRVLDDPLDDSPDGSRKQQHVPRRHKIKRLHKRPRSWPQKRPRRRHCKRRRRQPLPKIMRPRLPIRAAVARLQWTLLP
mmetsp:Transcript_8937/g.20093  ORF Transcript_8937/g.20093 Transcript_8937/m.20093 type:complete len:239 (-) Transcript_8937:3922-4638(-)